MFSEEAAWEGDMPVIYYPVRQDRERSTTKLHSTSQESVVRANHICPYQAMFLLEQQSY